MWNIFEQPWTLLTAAIIILLVMLIIRSILPEKKHLWQLLLPVLLAASAFALDLLIQTDLEKINALINAGVKAVEQENPDAIEPIISDNYHDSFHNTKNDLMNYCRRRLSEPLVEKNIKRIVTIDIQEKLATAVFTVRIVFDQRSYIYQSYKPIILTKLKLDLQKEPDNNWRITQAELLEIDMQPVNWQDIQQQTW
jgi:hypothetical protein